MLLYKFMCPMFAYSHVLNLEDWSCTERAPRPRNEWAGVLCGGGEGRGGGGSFLRLKSGHRHWQYLFSFNYLPQKYLMGLGLDILAYIYLHVQPKHVKRHALQERVHKRSLLVFAPTVLHKPFHLRQGTFELEADMFLDSYKTHRFQAFSKYNTCFSNG